MNNSRVSAKAILSATVQKYTQVSSETGKFGSKAILAVSLGNIVEWYDFALYGYFAEEISDAFFGGDSSTNLIFTYIVFGGAFVMRPVGGLICGYIGDKFGRENSLRLTIVTMGLSTVALGSIPNYTSIGSWATFLLVVVRMFQGLAVGGELVGSMVYTVEYAKPEKKLFYGAAILTTANLGTLLGAIISTIVHAAADKEEVVNGLWRIPFWLSSIVAMLGWWIRRDMKGTEEYVNSIKSSNPVMDAMMSEWRTILNITIVIAVWCVGFYTTYVWSFEWVGSLMTPNLPNAYAYNVLGMVVLFFAVPLSGWYLGRKEVPTNTSQLYSVLAIFFTQVVLMYFIGANKGYAWPYLLFVTINALTTGVFGAQMAFWMVQRVPNASVRFTVLGAGYNLAQALFGGTTPAIMTWLQEYGAVFPAIYYMLVCALALVSILHESPMRNEKYKYGELKVKEQSSES